MSLKKLLRFSWLEISRFKSISLFLILNLTLGLIGFFLLQIFQQSLALQSRERAQIVLGGDVSIRARRAFTEAERQDWESRFKFTEKSQFYSLFSMMRFKTEARLMSVGIFDSAYPLYGEFKLSAEKFSGERPLVWVDPEVQEIFKLQLGDQVEIGQQSFAFAGVIVEDPTRLFRGAGFAPRVLIHRNFLQSAKLIEQGSTFSEYWVYKVPPTESLSAIKAQLENSITDPIVRIENTSDSAEDSNRTLQYFTDYLGLVALVALGLCFLCSSYLLQWTFISKKKNIAIYKTLGLSDEKIVFTYLIQNFVISIVACTLGFILIKVSQPFLQHLLTSRFNLPLQLVFSAQAMLITGAIAVFGPMFIVIPQILQMIELRPLSLFQNAAPARSRNWYYYLWLLLSVVLFWLLSVWQSNSFKIATIFSVSVIFLIIFLQIVNRLLLAGLEKLSGRMGWLSRHAVRGLTRKKASAGLVFTTMGIATLVLSLLPHVKTSILNEIRPQNAGQIPSLFLFDIQPEQVESLQKSALAILQKELVLSPLVRSRILKINEASYERAVQADAIQTREDDEEARFRNRGVNLTYRSYLQDSESLTRGDFQGVYNGDSAQLPQVSIEKRYADRVKMKIGDVVTFDVQGLELKAQVSSFRQVRWTSFQPNFFILFPTGVLEEAPQIFLTSVAGVVPEKVKEFQQKVSSELKNVSIIDVTSTVVNSLKYIDQMSLALQFMAWLAVVVGLFVFIVLLNTQIKERLVEMNLLQILGTSQPQILKIILGQFVLLLVTSVLFGVIAGLVMAWVIISFFFDLTTVYDTRYLFLLVAVLIPVCGMALKAGLRPLQKLNPMDLIRQN